MPDGRSGRLRVLAMISSIAMGGTERNMVAYLPHVRDLGVDVTVCTLSTHRDSGLVEDFRATGLPRVDMGARKLLAPAAWRRFAAFVRRERYDIVHAQDQYTILFAASAADRRVAKTVMTRHVLDEPADDWRRATRARLVLAAARNRYDEIVAVSEATRRRFSEIARVPPERVRTIYNGLAHARFDTRHRRAATRAELGWSPDAKIIVMVAVLRAGKGHEVLFDALPRIRAEVPGAEVKLVGSGELDADLRRRAAPLGQAVTFMGERADVAEILGAADVLVLPSWSEALPTVLIEAGAAGLPAVATDVGGAGEIVVDGETGFIVPPGDTDTFAARTAAVLANPDLARRLGARGRERVRGLFSLEEQARRTVELYERARSRP